MHRPALFKRPCAVLDRRRPRKVKAWRQAEAERLTQERRPDLWAAYQNRLKGPK